MYRFQLSHPTRTMSRLLPSVAVMAAMVGLSPEASAGYDHDLELTVEDGVCTGIGVSNLALHGAAIDLDGVYMVTANNFLADGGDNFTTFATLDPAFALRRRQRPLGARERLGHLQPGGAFLHRPRERAVERCGSTNASVEFTLHVVRVMSGDRVAWLVMR